ncbi:Nodule Cysteine-Rich (NCR) secreted peptide [Medicago truncatula]|uniref:Nodule Cysteine-Rich (NCR) secreted peptide n=2 Tax=Medicago truncatula TaxID=3880 RepID=G7KNS7_MEDTR|nr:Nodule Cysteine-Rich (NCR) secreted peptide [Medicago truncatula]
MTQFIFFIYVLMIFLSLFLVESEKLDIRCATVDDCPKVTKPVVMMCTGKFCHYFFVRKQIL